MIIFPAIDIRMGKVVRLKQGKKEESTIFNENPLETAKYWLAQGARFLHIIDLDGAFTDNEANRECIKQIASTLDVPVQTGGGIRSLDICSEYLDAGVSRLIIGTAALENPELFAEMCAAYPGKIGVSLDAANGALKTRGWLADSGLDLKEAVARVEKAGAAFIVFTDISRDGMQSGLNLETLKALLGWTSLPVIGAGGVNTLEDIRKCQLLASQGNLEGVISGRALYEKTLDLRMAQDYCDACAR